MLRKSFKISKDINVHIFNEISSDMVRIYIYKAGVSIDKCCVMNGYIPKELYTRDLYFKLIRQALRDLKSGLRVGFFKLGNRYKRTVGYPCWEHDGVLS